MRPKALDERTLAAVALAIILMISPLLFMPIVVRADTDAYVVTEMEADTLSLVTRGGARIVIYQFQGRAFPQGVAIDSAGNYIVGEGDADILSKITPAGVRTVIYSFSPGSYPCVMLIDSSGNYIVTESTANVLSKITPAGVRTVIYSFSPGTSPLGFTIDPSGNFIVIEGRASVISKITPAGVRTVIYNFSLGANIQDVKVDSSGNYIVTEANTNVLSKITPAGVRTVICSFPSGAAPIGVVIDPSGNYVVTEQGDNKLSMVTPNGTRAVIYSFKPNTWPNGLAYLRWRGAEPTNLALSETPGLALSGQNISVSGFIAPAVAVNITLVFLRPDGSNFTRVVSTSSDGTYSLTYTPDAPGIWRVTANWAGDAQYLASSTAGWDFEVSSTPIPEFPGFALWLALASSVGVAMLISLRLQASRIKALQAPNP
jgi:DNA-binding beta-propeller fold protein YncE